MSTLKRLNNIFTAYENKLIEIMGMEAFGEWVLETSRDLFRQEVESMPDCDDKKYILEHFDEIAGEVSVEKIIDAKLSKLGDNDERHKE